MTPLVESRERLLYVAWVVSTIRRPASMQPYTSYGGGLKIPEEEMLSARNLGIYQGITADRPSP